MVHGISIDGNGDSEERISRRDKNIGVGGGEGEVRQP